MFRKGRIINASGRFSGPSREYRPRVPPRTAGLDRETVDFPAPFLYIQNRRYPFTFRRNDLHAAGEKNMRKCFVALIVVILYLSFVLTVLSSVTGQPLDEPLKGYTDEVDPPELTFESFRTGRFQSGMAEWTDTQIKPRGVYVKTYSSFLFDLFHIGVNIVGYQNDLFEESYIIHELCIPPALNYADPENYASLKAYVHKLEILQEKLAGFGKVLLVCISPSKANFHLDNIPQKYKNMAPAERLNAAECFSELISRTGVPCIMCRDMKDSLAYPPFYTTGTHWSWPFQQTVAKRVVDTMGELAGKQYVSICLDEIKKRSKPYSRDADLYNMMNYWRPARGQYYKYKETYEPGKDPLKLLIQGTSFSLGFLSSYKAADPDAVVYYINRKSYVRERFGSSVPFSRYDELDIARMLDETDGVVIETTEGGIPLNNQAFVDYMIGFLDTYTPGEVTP